MLLFLQNSEWQMCNYSDILSSCSGINNSFNSQDLIIRAKSSTTIPQSVGWDQVKAPKEQTLSEKKASTCVLSSTGTFISEFSYIVLNTF